MRFKVKLKQIQNERFWELINSLEIEDCCENCQTFDKSKGDVYLCAILGTCIGITLSERMKEYLINELRK